jgi:hypothetical protein
MEDESMQAPWTSELQPVTREHWTELVSAYPAGSSSWEVRRHHVRHLVEASANVCYTLDRNGRESATMVPCAVENASINGLMLHSDVQIEPRTAIELQVCMHDEIARLSGWVVHATNTVNGVKIGTHLDFDGLPADAREGIQTSARHAADGGNDRNRPWDVEAAAKAATSKKWIEDEKLAKQLIRGEHMGLVLEKLFVLACIAGVSYVIGSLVLPTIAR